MVVYGDEHHLPYERPPLSKGYLLGNDELETVFVHDPDWYDENDVDLRLGQQVTAIDTAAHVVRTRDGQQSYDRLLLATGSTPRHLAMADDSGAPVAYLRTIEDSQRLKEAFAASPRVVVVGAGWIGLETAAAARGGRRHRHGARVARPAAAAGARTRGRRGLRRPAPRARGRPAPRGAGHRHREAAFDGSGHAAVVRLADGDSVEADLVLVGIGVTPNVALAEEAGLATDNGILVDEHLATSDPDVFAVGDVANAEHPVLGRRIRVEHWDTAIEQGKTAAHAMLGHDVSYDRLPYFFTDQYDLGMEYVGSVGPDGYDEVVVRGDTSKAGGRTFTAFWLEGDRVVAGMHANDWDASDHLRAIVGTQVDVARLRDESTSLQDLAKG